MIRDPICGMEVENENVAFEFKGKKYFFCSNGCLGKFKKSPRDSLDKYVYDLVIIGAGPAGLTASVYASVLKIDTFLLTKDIGGQAIDSTKIKNYMGFDFISGKELIKKFKQQFLREHYMEHRIDEAVKVSRQKNIFEVSTKAGNRMLARSLIIATGMKRRTLGIPGEERLLRQGVSYNLIQDIGLFKGADAVVVGGGNSGVQAAAELKNSGCRVLLISKGKLIADPSGIEELKNNGKVTLLEGYDVIEIQGKDKVEGVVIQASGASTAREIPCKGVFIQIGFLPSAEFCQDLVSLNEKGEIKISPDCSANVAGIFACGDVTDGFGKRIIIASGEGAKAALSAKKYLLTKGGIR
jgi:NADH-dependent peroxiredoxin subunit F